MKRLVIFLSCIMIAGVLNCKKDHVDEYALIAFMLGDVKKNNIEVDIGDLIQEKDVITTGLDSFCDVKIGGSIIRIKEKSKVIISNLIRKGNLEDTTLGITVGKMLCKPKKLLKSEKFIVKTPTAVAGIRGTRFIVEADKAMTTRIKVFDGKVKVAKRIKQFEGSVDKVLEVAPMLETEKKIVITKNEVVKAEKIVEKTLKKETAKGGEVEISAIIEKTKNKVIADKKNIQAFAVQDFQKENKEIIDIKKKSPELINKIVKIVKLAKKEPKPEGRLLITRYEIYFIKNGKVVWEGKVVQNPLRIDDRIFIASGDYVFCASNDGPVLWKKKIQNDGKLIMKEDKLFVTSEGAEIALDAKTGNKM